MFYQLILLIFSLIPNHDFHTSWINLTYQEKNKEIKAMWHTDTEHLESALSSFSNIEIRFESTVTDAQKKIITDYLNAHYSLKINQKPCLISVATIEVNFAEIFIHFGPIKQRSKIKSITVTNSLLTEKFPNQKNMVQVNYLGNKYSMLFNITKTKDRILIP
jgi:hypothetical protein